MFIPINGIGRLDWEIVLPIVSTVVIAEKDCRIAGLIRAKIVIGINDYRLF